MRQWAERKFQGKDRLVVRDKWVRKDLLSFEGNAQSIRILFKNFERMGGLPPTMPIIGALSKYPKPSFTPNHKKNPKDVSEKKFGYFKPEKDRLVGVFRAMGVTEKSEGVFSRHPLALLMEAADDIAYGIIDLEDSYKLKIVSYDEVESVLLPLARKQRVFRDSIEATFCEFSEDQRVYKLRAAAFAFLTDAVSKVFIDDFEQITNGIFKTSLIGKLNDDSKSLYDRLIQMVREKAYVDRRVLEVESVGFRAIDGLLSMFFCALTEESSEAKKLLQLFPASFLTADSKKHKGLGQLDSRLKALDDLSFNERMYLLMDYVSGMTDSYAVQMFQRLSGISLPV
jgi:dGTPase